jgi:hypothetical protein
MFDANITKRTRVGKTLVRFAFGWGLTAKLERFRSFRVFGVFRGSSFQNTTTEYAEYTECTDEKGELEPES